MKEYKPHKINSLEKLDRLIIDIDNKKKFATNFIFSNNNLYTQFLNSLNIDIDKFSKKHYYIDKEQDLHIAESSKESSKNRLWISTMGLIAKSDPTDNLFVSACLSQIKVVITLLDKAQEISSDETVYNIDSDASFLVDLFTVPLYHNVTFCMELLAKAYLSIFQVDFKKIHTISALLEKVEFTMKENNHLNTMFEENIYELLEQQNRHLSTNPGKINEAYIKYYDNPDDITLISFNFDNLAIVKYKLYLAYDIIKDLYKNKSKSDCLKHYPPNF